MMRMPSTLRDKVLLTAFPVLAAAAATSGSSVAALSRLHPANAALRGFAAAAAEHLKGPALRPFAGLLKSLPPAGRQPGVVISTRPTKNISCAGGACTPTKARAILNVHQLTRMLADQNVTIGTSATAPDIRVEAPFSWASGNTLTLQAIGSIEVDAHVSDAGAGALTLSYDTTGGGGALLFDGKGNISFLGTANPLTINGQPYLLVRDIRTMARLMGDNPSGSFALAANYDAKQDGTYTQSPITGRFNGNFEGLGNSISNLRVKAGAGARSIGFVERTGPAAHLGNLGIEGKLTVPGCADVGGVVGKNEGTLSQAVFKGTINLTYANCGVAWVGGIAGENSGTISFSHATGTIAGGFLGPHDLFMGGLLGTSSGVVDHSWAGVAISLNGNNDSFEAFGGLIGQMGGGTADQTFAVGSVTVNGYFEAVSSFGGLIGFLDHGSVSNASASGAVSTSNGGNSNLGGLFGDVDSLVENAVATGAVSSDKCFCGGAIGEVDAGQVSDSTSYGSVTASDTTDSLVGGFAGRDDNPGDLSNDGWCTTSSGFTDIDYGAGSPADDPGIAPFSC